MTYQLDLSLFWVCLLKNMFFLNHQKSPGFTNNEFLRARATACICSKSSINTVIANSQLIIFEWNLIFSFLNALMPTDRNSAVIWGLDVMCWDLKASLLSERRDSPRPSQCHHIWPFHSAICRNEPGAGDMQLPPVTQPSNDQGWLLRGRHWTLQNSYVT